MNILNLYQDLYSVTIVFNDGTKAVQTMCLDLFDDNEVKYKFEDCNRYEFFAEFNASNSYFDTFKNGNVIDGENVKLDWEDDYYLGEDELAKLNIRKARKCEYILIRRKLSKPLHYTV